MPYLDMTPTYPRHFFNPGSIADEWNGLSHGHLNAELRKYVGNLRESAIDMLLAHPNPLFRVVALFNVYFDRLRVYGCGQVAPEYLPCLQRIGLLGLRSRAAMEQSHPPALRYEVLQLQSEFQWFLDDRIKTAC